MFRRALSTAGALSTEWPRGLPERVPGLARSATCVALVLFGLAPPASAQHEAFGDGLIEFTASLLGAHGDEGVAARAALDRMERGLAEWDRTLREFEANVIAITPTASVNRKGGHAPTGDYDGDGLLDLVVTNHEFEMASLYRNLGKRLFAYVTRESGIAAPTRPYVGFGVALVDYDNDTRLDLAIANGHVMDNTTLFRQGSTHAQPNLLLRNEDGRRFRGAGTLPTAGGTAPATPHKVSRGLAAGDYDNDGDLDLLVTNNGDRPDLLRNDGGHRRHALHIQLVARTSAPNGIGARVVATAGPRTLVRDVKAGSSYLSQHDTRVHLGLDQANAVERLEVYWPSGTTEVFRNVPANQILTVREGSGIVARRPLNRP